MLHVPGKLCHHRARVPRAGAAAVLGEPVAEWPQTGRCYTSRVNHRPNAQFCSVCAHAITRRIPAGDARERDCCDSCGAIHYLNPRPVVGTIPVWGEQVLLCRRAIEPRYGYWTLPAGFMEVGETAAQGAQRETEEEASANVEMGPLFSMIDVPAVEQIHIFYRARLLDQNFGPGAESLEVQLFREDQIPWDEIAFRTVATTLRLFFQDRAHGAFGTHTRELLPLPQPG
jgi:ADP-ribose pyrophosphatase YjhB (NUDIX family)